VADFSCWQRTVAADAIVKKLEECQRKLPTDLLARGVAALSHSAESFLAMRVADPGFEQSLTKAARCGALFAPHTALLSHMPFSPHMALLRHMPHRLLTRRC
jgi:hypothetical protein